MSLKDIFVIAAVLLVCFGALRAGFRFNVIGRGQPQMDELDFTNGADKAVSAIFVEAEGAQTQELLHGRQLAPGEKASLKIDRWQLPGAADVRVVYGDGSEKLWPGLPMKGIFSLAGGRGGEPIFEDLTVCS